MTAIDISPAAVLEGRMAMYGLLARLFRAEVDQELLDQMQSMRFPQNTGNEDVDKGYRMLHQYLCQAGERALDELAVDYVRTFIGGGLKEASAAYPFESVYTSAKHLLMQEARDEVVAIYRSVGLDKDTSWHDSEDHLALELEFEQILCQRTIDALRANEEEAAKQLLVTQSSFLDGHLLNWVPRLTRDIQAFAKTEFYSALALITHGFLTEDREVLASIIESLSSEHVAVNA